MRLRHVFDAHVARSITSFGRMSGANLTENCGQNDSAAYGLQTTMTIWNRFTSTS
jgi:hypothetical protein